MEKRNRVPFQKRTNSMIPTHDMGKKLKDPWKNKMKAEDWMNFIVTASVEALEGLIDDRVLAIWKNFRKGFMIHTQKKVITPEDRNEAKCAFFQVGVGCEQLKWEKMMTLATHQIAIEADWQISDTGPIRESMGAWIERLCFRVVEPTKRMAICARPDMAAIRYILMRHLLLCYEDQVPNIAAYIPPSKRLKHGKQDTVWGAARFLGNGVAYDFTKEEECHMKTFLKKENKNFDSIQVQRKENRLIFS